MPGFTKEKVENILKFIKEHCAKYSNIPPADISQRNDLIIKGTAKKFGLSRADAEFAFKNNYKPDIVWKYLNNKD